MYDSILAYQKSDYSGVERDGPLKIGIPHSSQLIQLI